MENQTNNKGGISDDERKIIDKVLQETIKKPMGAGLVGLKTCHYQPHNYRVYFDFIIDFQNPALTPLFSGVSGVTAKRQNHDSEIFIKGFNNCSLVLRKKSIEIINLIEHKRFYSIEITTNALKQIIDIHVNKLLECKKVLKEFISLFGGVSEYKLLRVSCQDNKIQNEDIIDKIPASQTFHAELVKKLYKSPSVEFKTPMHTVNYLTNRAIENIAPQLDYRLNTIDTTLNKQLTPVLKKLTEQISLHLEVQQETKTYLKAINEKQRQKAKYKQSWYYSLG